MKEPVESTEDNRLKEQVVQIQKEEEEWKGSCKKLREDSERKQAEIIPMNAKMKKKHSSDKKSKIKIKKDWYEISQPRQNSDKNAIEE